MHRSIEQRPIHVAAGRVQGRGCLLARTQFKDDPGQVAVVTHDPGGWAVHWTEALHPPHPTAPRRAT
jgi:hypothetical protein